MFSRTRHAWVLTSTVFKNTFGVIGVFKTKEEGSNYAKAAGIKEGDYQLTGWEVEKS